MRVASRQRVMSSQARQSLELGWLPSSSRVEGTRMGRLATDKQVQSRARQASRRGAGLSGRGGVLEVVPA